MCWLVSDRPLPGRLLAIVMRCPLAPEAPWQLALLP